MKEKNRGITLIALIVTIILLIILGSVTIGVIKKGDIFGITEKVVKDTNDETNEQEDEINELMKEWERINFTTIK